MISRHRLIFIQLPESQTLTSHFAGVCTDQIFRGDSSVAGALRPACSHILLSQLDLLHRDLPQPRSDIDCGLPVIVLNLKHAEHRRCKCDLMCQLLVQPLCSTAVTVCPGGAVEAYPPSDTVTCVTVDLLLEPGGHVITLSCGDQLQGSCQFEAVGSTVPQTSVHPQTLDSICARVGQVCLQHHIVGHVSLDLATFMDLGTTEQKVRCSLEMSRP